MTEKEIVRVLEERGIVLRNSHFRYTSGKHGEDYIDKNALLANTTLSGALAAELARKWFLKDADTPFPEAVVGPAMSGAILAHLVAQELGKVPNWSDDEPVYAAFAEKDAGAEIFRLRRNYDKVVEGRTVLVVEDVINTGGTALGTAHAVMEAGGTVVGVAVLWNRGANDKLALRKTNGSSLELPITALVHGPLPTWKEADCPFCHDPERKRPLNINFGHGASFLTRDKPSC